MPDRNALAPRTATTGRSADTRSTQAREQTFNGGGVFGGAGFDAQNVLAPLVIHTPRAENVVLGETLAANVDYQNLDLVPAPLPQLLELFGAGFNGLSANGALGYSRRGCLLRQDFLIFACGNAAQQGAQHILAEPAILGRAS